MDKLLSIAIPTYNRCDCLKEELECIIPQILPYKNSVEIVISDNASPETDGTQNMIAEIQKRYAIDIDYKKLSSSIYFEENFKEVISRTHGKYIHMTGDDDIFSPAFYDYIMKIVTKEDNIGLIYFNYLRGDANCSNGKIKEPIYESNQFIGSTEAFVKKVMENAGFMSSLVFRRDCWDAGEKKEKEDYYGYHFLGRLYQGALSLKTNSCYCYVPMVIQRNPLKRTWSSSFPLYYYVGYSNIFRDLDCFIPGIYNNWLSKLHDIRKSRRNINILFGIRDKHFYLKKKKEFLPHLSRFQKIIFLFVISPISFRLLKSISYHIVNIYYSLIQKFC